jgi:hypothetical protein
MWWVWLVCAALWEADRQNDEKDDYGVPAQYKQAQAGYFIGQVHGLTVLDAAGASA